jgi:hypothetical protein
MLIIVRDLEDWKNGMFRSVVCSGLESFQICDFEMCELRVLMRGSC